MIVEQRDYHVYTGKLPELVRLYADEGIAIQQEHLGRLIGVFTTDVGELSTYTSMWAYESAGEREERRLIVRFNRQHLPVCSSGSAEPAVRRVRIGYTQLHVCVLRSRPGERFHRGNGFRCLAGCPVRLRQVHTRLTNQSVGSTKLHDTVQQICSRRISS